MQLETSACQVCNTADPSAKHMMCQLTDLVEWDVKEKKRRRFNPLYTVSLSLFSPSFGIITMFSNGDTKVISCFFQKTATKKIKM